MICVEHHEQILIAHALPLQFHPQVFQYFIELHLGQGLHRKESLALLVLHAVNQRLKHFALLSHSHLVDRFRLEECLLESGERIALLLDHLALHDRLDNLINLRLVLPDIEVRVSLNEDVHILFTHNPIAVHIHFPAILAALLVGQLGEELLLEVLGHGFDIA